MLGGGVITVPTTERQIEGQDTTVHFVASQCVTPFENGAFGKVCFE
mgnify:CR=1 FL=1